MIIKELIPLLGTPIFMAATQEYLYITWLWQPVGLILVGPIGQ